MPSSLLPSTLPSTDADARALIAAIDAQLAHHHVSADGHEVVFRRIGSGPPLVLVHGGHGSWLHWVRNLDALSRRHTLWLPDMPSYGDSATLASPPSLERLAQVLAAALDGLLGAGTPLDLAGFSFGGLSVAHAAARRLEQGGAVRRVALLGTSGHGMMRRDRTKMLDWKGLEDEALRDQHLRHNLGALMLHDVERIDALALALHRQACHQTRFRSKGYAGRAVLIPALDVLDAHGVPVLLAWGEHDVTGTPQETGPALVAGRASRRWEVLPDAGHWVQYERPAQTEALLEAWFAEGAPQPL